MCNSKQGRQQRKRRDTYLIHISLRGDGIKRSINDLQEFKHITGTTFVAPFGKPGKVAKENSRVLKQTGNGSRRRRRSSVGTPQDGASRAREELGFSGCCCLLMLFSLYNCSLPSRGNKLETIAPEARARVMTIRCQRWTTKSYTKNTTEVKKKTKATTILYTTGLFVTKLASVSLDG